MYQSWNNLQQQQKNTILLNIIQHSINKILKKVLFPHKKIKQ